MALASVPGLEIADETVRKAQTGDAHAFRDIVLATEARLYSVVLRITGNQHDAEDALQEAYLKAHARLADFQFQSRFTTWLYRIAVNAALMKVRGRQRLQKRVQTDADLVNNAKTAGATPIELILQSEMRDVLESAIDALPDAYRTAFVLKDIEQMPIAEVAEVLKISPEGVYSRLKRARRQLRDQLAPLLTASNEEI